MDGVNLIRSGIFFVGGIVSIIFRERLNNFKNRMLKKLNLKKWVKDERKGYVYTGIVLLIISLILFVYSVSR